VVDVTKDKKTFYAKSRGKINVLKANRSQVALSVTYQHSYTPRSSLEPVL